MSQRVFLMMIGLTNDVVLQRVDRQNTPLDAPLREVYESIQDRIKDYAVLQASGVQATGVRLM